MQVYTLSSFFQNNQHISPLKVEQMVACFHEKTIHKNDLLLKEGQVCNEYLLLSSGYMRAYTHDTNGTDITTAFYAPGQIVFEVASYFNRIPSTENIQAITDCHGWYINFKELNNMFHTMPEFREFGRSVLVQGFSALKLRMLAMINQTAEQRYAALIEHHANIFKHAALKHIASYLGITDTSLSRIRKQYVKK